MGTLNFDFINLFKIQAKIKRVKFTGWSKQQRE